MLIPTHIYELKDPEIHNRANFNKTLGFIEVTAGLVFTGIGLYTLAFWEKIERDNIEDIGD